MLSGIKQNEKGLQERLTWGTETRFVGQGRPELRSEVWKKGPKKNTPEEGRVCLRAWERKDLDELKKALDDRLSKKSAII